MHRIRKAVTASVLGLLGVAIVVPSASAAPASSTTCAPLYDGTIDGLKRYTDCRFDGYPGGASPSPSPTPTVTPSPTPSPTPTVKPTVTPSPTPTPTATPTATTARPSASNTGVPSGTVLTNYTGPRIITTPGTIIDSKKVTVCLDIRANNVQIKNSLLTAGCFVNVLADNGNTGIVISDTEINGIRDLNNDSAVSGGGYTCLRCNVHDTVDGFKAGSATTIRNSWIHNLTIANDSHNDGVQSLGTSSLTISGNDIVVADGATSAVILSTGSADVMKNILIEKNWLGGGAYTVYGGYQQGADVRSRVDNIRIQNNLITTAVFAKGGYYGVFTSTDSPVVVQGNTWLDGPKKGQTVS